jgi:hypothetical protein
MADMSSSIAGPFDMIVVDQTGRRGIRAVKWVPIGDALLVYAQFAETLIVGVWTSFESVLDRAKKNYFRVDSIHEEMCLAPLENVYFRLVQELGSSPGKLRALIEENAPGE